ncbi:glutamate receptor [Elysia marginata]|uniref:Glutamate receptor n=1 Tax=Elysia marginata TaxID=1093978 RepID=A0AAV4IQC7_9GAST|nr:glutamate receptor [Elysia marginata]
MLEMNLSKFKIGGVNITGFQLVDSKNQTSKAKKFIDNWSTLDPTYWPGAGTRSLNYEAALAVDSVRLFTRAFGKILEMESDFIRRSRLASLDQSLKCTDDSMVRAGHGEKILEQMKKVKFEGISGYIAFDDHGLRKDFTLDVYNVALTRGTAKVGFDYQIRFVKDGRYGSPKSNGTWDGMVGELIRHEADMAIAPFTITADRSRVIDFTKPFMSLGISIMIKRPQPEGKHFFSFMDPLSYEIWMCIVFAYIGVSVVLFLVSRFRSMSGRIVGSVWWFFTLIIISSYTANLAAFLTVERMLTPIDSAEDLARQTEIQYGTISSGSTKAFFKNSQFQTYQRMWAYMMSAQPSVFVQKHEEGIARVRNSKAKYAYLTESTTIDYVSSRKPCDTLKVGNNLNSDGFGIGTPVGSDLREQLNFAVLELREDGDLGKWQRNWFDKGDCEQYTSNKDGAQSALDLDNVAGIFLILIGGLVTAIISAAAEFLYKSKMDSEKSLTSFGSAIRSKARLSFKGHIDKDREGSTRSRSRSHGSVTYTYQGPTHVVGSSHGFEDANTHTEV